MTKKSKFIILGLGFLGLILAANFALAADFGINEVNNGLGGSITATDPRVLVGRIIQIFLGFLGMIAVVLVMYAGFLWATSNGNEDKIDEAKKILKNSLIGLAIILSSWAITTFVLASLMEAINGGSGGNNPGGGNVINPGLGAIGSCSVESVYPANNQEEVPRNTSLIVTFKEEIKLDSVCVNNSGVACACSNNSSCDKINPKAIRVYKTALNDACTDSCPATNSNVTDVLVSVAKGTTTLVLMPIAYLGSSDGNTAYSVKFTEDIKKADGKSMFSSCRNGLSWDFAVSSKIDLTPPIVVPAGVFPLPDELKDLPVLLSTPVKAQGLITVKALPKTYISAQVKSIEYKGSLLDNNLVTLNYHGSLSRFQVKVVPSDQNKAQLFSLIDGSLLGSADFNGQGQVTFNSYFTLQTNSRAVGDAWDIEITPEQLADTLTIGSDIFTFSTSTINNNIEVGENTALTAEKIQIKLSGRPDITPVSINPVNAVNLEANVAGSSGNNISVNSSNQAVEIKPLSGGTDLQESIQVKDKKDRPMNSVIQINFNEAINPITVSGSADEVKDYITVVNYSATSTGAGTNCTTNSDCQSYNCGSTGKCVGNYIGGQFMISNGYKTVEFISDKECGINGCGEKIYCLPANSHLAIKMNTPDLKTCVSDSDCMAFSPYKICAATAFGYKTCQDQNTKNYPAATSTPNGIIDAALNALDGNRDTYADGPADFYNENKGNANLPTNKDRFTWSFYINDQILIKPPIITEVKPKQNDTGEPNVTLASPVTINFDTLMMNSSLRTGSTLVKSLTKTISHKLVNLFTSSPSPLGYWIEAENKDTATALVPLDGEPDMTIVKILHSPFFESMTYNAQVGSGVKDIYQNCFKPSASTTCNADANNPSCCFGVTKSSLSPEGNCIK